MKNTDYTDCIKRSESAQCKFVQSVSVGALIEFGHAVKTHVSCL